VYVPLQKVAAGLLLQAAAIILVICMPAGAYCQHETADSLALAERLRLDEEYIRFMERLGENPKDFEALSELGFKLLEYGLPDSATAVFKTAVSIDDSIAEVYLGLGRAYLTKGENYLSIQAAVKRLIRIDNYARAITAFERALAIDPNCHDARCGLAETYMEKAYGAKGSKKNFENAARIYEELIRRNPAYPDIHFRLGQAYYELNDYEKAEKELSAQISASGGHPPSSVFLGWTYYHMNQREKACEYYLEGIANIADAKLLERIHLDTRLLFTGDETGRYKALPLSRRGKFLAGFWRQNDPNIMTPVNERLIEHFRRVDFAKTYFDEKNYRGYDDRGMIYIKYGKPDDDYSDLESSLWIYNRIEKHLAYFFSSKGGFMPYRIVYPLPPQAGMYVDISLQDIAYAHAPPQNFTLRFRETPIDFPFSFCQFRGRDGMTDVEVSYAVPHEQLDFGIESNIPSVSVETKIVVQDSGRVRIDEAATTFTIPYDRDSGNGYTVGMEPFRLPAGDYRSGIQERQEEARRLGIYHVDQPVRDFTSDSLMISDIQLVSVPNPPEIAGVKSRKDLRTTPYPFPFARKSLPLLLYCEIYNLGSGAGGRSSYVVEYRVQRDKTASGGLGGMLKKLGRFITRSSGKFISISQERSGTSSDVNELILLDIGGIPDTDAVITVTVRDRISGSIVESTRNLKIIR